MGEPDLIDRDTTRSNPSADSVNGASAAQRLALLATWSFLLSPLAFQAWLSGWRGLWDILFLFNLGMSLLWVALAHFITRRPLAMHLALAPLYLTTAVDLFLLGTFGARLSSGYVGIALTDHVDTLEFLSAYARPVAVAALILLLVYLPSLYAIRGLRQSRSPRLAALAAALLLGIYGFAVVNSTRLGNTVERAVLDLAGHENSAPMGAAFQAGLALNIHADNAELRTRRARHSFGATKASSAEGEVYVWVIGESARPANWSLFGYARETTPRLGATSGLLAFPDMMTTAPHTSVAVPSMLSLRPITDWSSVQAEQSIVGAFNEAGFKTYWLSMQDADSWSGIIPQVAAEAKRRRYGRGFDGELLDEFGKILQDAPRGGKLFIVLHTKGSHFNFARRYPPEFARFSTPGGTQRDKMIDTYDNSILYTDWLLAELINMLAHRNTQATLLYASDHGENLLDDDRKLFGHALGTQYDLPAAAFMWFSDGTRRSHPEQIRNAEQHAAAPLSLSNLPHSLLELAGIQAKGLDPKMSLFSPRFELHPRSYIVRGELLQEQAASASASGH